jgi:N-acyl-D-aspartate/D-glutamate deacylase
MSPPGDPPTSPPDPARRKLLLAGGFALANFALLKNLGTTDTSSDSSPTVRVEVAGQGSTTPPQLVGSEAPPPAGHRFGLVVRGGRVIDPETGYDAIADVGIDGDRVRSISTEPLIAAQSVDATGLIVSPGFIDVLSYEPNEYGVWFKLGDGVTTNLGMHGLNNTAEGFFDFFGRDDHRPPVHYGGAFDDDHMRHAVAEIGTRAATASQIDELQQLLEEGIASGWIGVSIEPEYTPHVTNDEYRRLAEVAARSGLPLFSHIRSSDPQPGPDSSLTALDELLQLAEQTGVGVHVDHITSMTTHVMPEAIQRIDDARARGVNATACIYPYDFWATTLASARFAPGWQERFRIDYGDLEVPGTGERLTESSFTRYQKENLLVAAHAIPESDVQTALRVPWVMIGSDAILEPGDNNHPRSTGAFTRTLGRYVRETGLLTWPEALAKMTILPAQRLEGRVSSLRRKGRLQMGADADLTIFDPNTVGDRSTIADPAQMAAGVEYVVVAGQVVKEGETLHKDRRLGQPIRPDAA